MSERRRVTSGSAWEAQVGYCRAVQAGSMVFVSGTLAVGDDGEPVGVGDPRAQAERCFAIIRDALAELEVGMQSVVRTRMFVTDASQWAAFGAAHRAAFPEGHEPCATMVEVAGFVDDRYLIEIEVDAVV